MSTHSDSHGEEEDDFIKVIEKEDSDFMEFPKEEDGTVLLRTIQTQFPSAIGLKYKGSSGAWRAVREVDNALVAPKGGWGDQVYSLTFSEGQKRKIDMGDNGEKDTKYVRTDVNNYLKDLAVLGLPFKTANGEFKEYIEKKYGELVHCQIKFDMATGKSKGFGFVRFKEEDAAKEALNGEDYIDGRRIYIKLKKDKPMKMYVSPIPEGTTADDLKEYFSQFGEVIDAYVPQPFRRYAFFTFASTEDGRRCLKEQHIFRGVHLTVKLREEKNNQPTGGFGYGGGRGGMANGGAGRGGIANGGGRGGFQGGYQGRNMPPQPPYPQAQNNASADLKNMLLQFLST